MVYVRRFHRGPAPPKPGDHLLLDYDARSKRRSRATLASGREVALQLPRGTLLAHGDWLEADDGTLILVSAAAEPLSTVQSEDALLLARVAYHLGNRHVPLQIEPGRLAYRHDHVLDDLVTRLHLTPGFEHAPFVPERGPYGQGAMLLSHTHAGAAHAHDHTHSHDHDQTHSDDHDHDHDHDHTHSHDHDP
jgi:urease accessory protein